MSLLNNKIKLDVLFNNSDIDERVRTHLAKVYATLGLALGCAAAGAIAHLYFNLGGILVRRRLAVVGLFLFSSLTCHVSVSCVMCHVCWLLVHCV